MNELDYAVILVMVISVGVGVFRGAIHEIMHIVGWVLAFVLAYNTAGRLAPYFADWMSEPVYRVALAWLAVFVAVLIAASLIASLLSEVVRKLGLGGLDRAVGGVIGAARGVLVLVALTLAAGMTKFPQTSLWRNAASTAALEAVAMHARALLPESLASRIFYRQAPPQGAPRQSTGSYSMQTASN
jgi:membrane protein required for colicin V production